MRRRGKGASLHPSRALEGEPASRAVARSDATARPAARDDGANAARRVAMAPPGATRGPANEGGGARARCAPRAAVRTRQQKTGASVTAWTTRGR